MVEQLGLATIPRCSPSEASRSSALGFTSLMALRVSGGSRLHDHEQDRDEHEQAEERAHDVEPAHDALVVLAELHRAGLSCGAAGWRSCAGRAGACCVRGGRFDGGTSELL